MKIMELIMRRNNENLEDFLLNSYKSYLKEGYLELNDHRESLPFCRIKPKGYYESCRLNELYQQKKITLFEYAKKCDLAFRVTAVKKAIAKYPNKREKILQFYYLQLLIGDDYVDIRYRWSLI